MNRFMVFGLLGFWLAGCSRAVDKADLPGIYTVEEGSEKQQITLDKNGEYSNSLYVNEVLSWTKSGKWVYDRQGDKKGITFSEFKFGLKDTSDVSGYWFVVPGKGITGNVRLCFDVDLNRCFGKP